MLRRAGPLLHARSLTTAPKPQISQRSAVDLALIALTGIGISGFLLFSSNRARPDESTMEGKRGVFTVPVVNQTDGQTTKTLTLLSPAEVNSRLKENEASYAVTRLKNPVFRYDTASLASNAPIEDDSCCVILERDPAGEVLGDLMFWGVFDGHSGWHTSRKLASSLVSYVARELDLVFRHSRPYSDLATASKDTSKPASSSRWSLFSSKPPSPDLDLHDPIIQAAMMNAFNKLDSDIVTAPIKLLEKYQRDGTLPRPKQGDMTPEQTEALNTLLPALSGSCALLAFLDAGRNKLHVAVTGDSRAVMGTYIDGKWRAESLSEDQTGKSLTEVQRIRSEHPPNEAETVITRGRVLGGLEPSRAFGDSRYKWPLGMAERLANAFHPGSIRGNPRNYLTPPYVTARPEVITVDLSQGLSVPQKSLASFLPVSTSTDSPAPQAQRFIVLATDGLYDRLSNEEIVALVGSHLSGVRGTQSRSAVLRHVSDTSPHETMNPGHTHAPRQEPMRGEGEVYVFEDGNIGTHLIRNALGGAKREQVSALLSIPAPLSRRYRDDITVTVVLLGDVGPGGEGGVGGVHRRDDLDFPAKAKL